jgi:hypothetical protein
MSEVSVSQRRRSPSAPSALLFKVSLACLQGSVTDAVEKHERRSGKRLFRGKFLTQRGFPPSSPRDMTTPLSNTLQPLSHITSTQVQPTSSPTQVFDGPITHSRAKKLQQEVHALLYEFQLNTNENFILPKSCMLILLRFTKEEGQNISKANQQEELCPSQSSVTELARRNSHIF